MKDDLAHGGALDRMRVTFPDAPEPWIDLSTGINPWGYDNTSFSRQLMHHLPTREVFEECRAAMAASFGAPSTSVLPAPGSELLIRLLPNLIAPRRIAILSPTYGDHRHVWSRAGIEIVETADPLSAADDVDAVVLCNPNNPDGRVFELEELETARGTLARHGGWLVLDEAYAELQPSQSMASRGGAEGMIALRSFGKFYGLAGLRLAALIAPEAVINRAGELLGDWSVAGPALAIGTRAYGDTEWQMKTKVRLAQARERLDRLLLTAGVTVLGGTDLFRYVESPGAHQLWAELAKAGIYTRRFEWSPCHLRIGLPPDAEAESRLAVALSSSAK